MRFLGEPTMTMLWARTAREHWDLARAVKGIAPAAEMRGIHDAVHAGLMAVIESNDFMPFKSYRGHSLGTSLTSLVSLIDNVSPLGFRDVRDSQALERLDRAPGPWPRTFQPIASLMQWVDGRVMTPDEEAGRALEEHREAMMGVATTILLKYRDALPLEAQAEFPAVDIGPEPLDCGQWILLVKPFFEDGDTVLDADPDRASELYDVAASGASQIRGIINHPTLKQTAQERKAIALWPKVRAGGLGDVYRIDDRGIDADTDRARALQRRDRAVGYLRVLMETMLPNDPLKVEVRTWVELKTVKVPAAEAPTGRPEP